MGCPAFVFAAGLSGGLYWSGGLLCRKMSNDAVERASPTRQKLPAGEPDFEMVRGYDASARTDVSPEAARRPGAAPGIGGIPGRVTKQTPAAPSPRYKNTYLRNQPAHVLVVDLLQHFAAV